MFRKLIASAIFVAASLSCALAQPAISQPSSLPVQIPNARDASQIDIASGVATPTRATHLLGAESGTADDLVTITATSFNTGASGSFIVAAGDTITVKTTGNIATFDGGDIIAAAGAVLNWRRNEAGTGVIVWQSGAGGADLSSLQIYNVDDQAGANDQARIQAAIDAAEASGGIVNFTAGKAYSMSGCTTRCLLINSSDVVLEGNGATLATTGSAAAFDMIEVAGTDNVAATTLAADSALGALTITLTSATGFAVGDLIRIDQAKTVTILFNRTFYAKITGLAGAVATLEAPLPFEVGGSTGTNSVTKVTPVENIVIRNLIFDKSAQTVSSGNVRGALFIQNAAYSRFQNLRFIGNDNHFNMQSFWGYRNTYADITSSNGGGGTTSDADLQIGRESFTTIHNIRSQGSDGFGFTVHRSAYMSISSIAVNDTTARGLKLEGVVASTGGDWRNMDAGTTGIMLARGTSYNSFSNIVSVNNGTAGGAGGDNYGLWLDNDDNDWNTLTGLVLLANGDYDLFVHDTSENNQFINIRVSNILKVKSNPTSNLFSNINGLSTWYTDDTATAGPLERIRRYSASPAANDELGGRIFDGFDSGGNATAYCYYLTKIVDPTDTTEDGEFRMRCITAGADTLIAQLTGAGSTFGSATGGAQGAGTINAKGFYVDGVAVGGVSDPITITNTDAGATAGPQINLVRDSASPANGDSLGQIRFLGEDSASNSDPYAYIYGNIVDATSTSEDGTLQFGTAVAGAFATRGYFQAGLVVGSPTGADKGVGTINATAVYDDNVLLTDYVFDLWSGIDRDYSPAVQAKADALDIRMFDPAVFADYWKTNGRLFGMPDLNDVIDGTGVLDISIGEIAQRLMQTVELQAIHIETLREQVANQNERIQMIEAWACANDNAPAFCEASGQ